MDINSQQQINTFVGGMNTDTSDALLDSSQYRYAENLRIVTNTDSNSGELRIIDGILTLIDKYINKDTDSKRWDEILYMTSVRQYLILITKDINKQTKKAGWSIYRWEEGKEKPDLIFGPCGEAIWDESGNTNLSVITRYESELNIKMYIVDGIHQIMCINIYDTPLNGSNVPNDIKLLISSLENPIEPLSVNISENTGELKAAKVLYAYRLYLKYGSVTTLSPLSKLLSLYKDNNTGYEKGAKTGRAVDINIPNKTYEYMSKIQIFRINYIENGQEPTVTLIVDGDYVANSNIIDDGTKDISTISLSELLSYIQTGIIPKELETKHNYLFAGNIKYITTDIDKKFKDLNIDEYITIEFRQDDSAKYIISDEQQDDGYDRQHPSFRPGETYRFGIIFYDTEGNKSSVFHLKDLTVDKNFYLNIFLIKNSLKYDANPIGIFIKQEKVIPNCSQFEIVRCIRTLNDKRTISLGIIGRPMELFQNTRAGNSNKFSTKKEMSHSGFMTMNDFRLIHTPSNGGHVDYFAKLSDKFIQFASPEYCYLPDDIKLILNRYKDSLTIDTVYEQCARLTTASEYNDVHESTKRYKYLDPLYSKFNSNRGPYKFQYISGNSDLLVSSDYVGIIEQGLSFVDNSVQVHNILNRAINDMDVIKFNLIYPYYQRMSQWTSSTSYFSLYSLFYGSQNSNDFYKYTVSNIAYPSCPNWNDLAKNEQIVIKDDIDTIGDYTYYEWSNPFLSQLETGTDSVTLRLWKTDQLLIINSGDVPQATFSRFPIGIGGKHILFETSDSFPSCYLNVNTTQTWGYGPIYTADGPFVITVADLKKPANPYGGDSKYSIENSVYYSYGLIFKNEFNQTDVRFFGDSYIRMFKYNALHSWYDAYYNQRQITKMATVYCVPIMMDIDLHAQFGTLYNRNMTKPYYLLDEPAAFDGYVQETGAYLYNTAYNQLNTAVPYPAYKEEDNEDSYDVRVHYSELKTNNEHIDSWTLFKSMNFLEVDSSFGLITDLKLFKDRLIFWQEHATGILAVNERVILQDANNTQVVLGTGSVLDRYDYISTTYGMKPKQHSSCVSDDYLYWWDGYNKEILQYAEKYSATPLSLVKNIRNYINQNEESNKPHIYYNRKYKEVGCQCLKNGNNSNGEVIAYNELLQRFTSVYTARNIDRSINYGFAPIYDTYLNGNLLITDGNSVYKQSLNEKTSLLFNTLYVQPYLKYIVNTNNTLGKTYDILIIGGNLYNSKDKALTVDSKLDVIDFEKVQRFLNQPSLKDEPYNHQYHTTEHLKSLQLRYTTPLKQEGVIKDGKGITNREYDYRLNIPRETGNDVYGGRLRGKTMQCELWSTSSSTDFSLQYITTKYRMSWS